MGIHRAALGLLGAMLVDASMMPLPRGSLGQSSGAAFAVVRPFWEGELSTLRETLLRPSAPRACEGGPLPVDLVLYYAERANRTLDKVLQLLAGELASDRCYRQVHLQYAGIKRAVSYPAAPCTQFVDIFTMAPPLWGYTAIYWMELDVQPVRDNWLQLILPVMQEAALGKVWVTGGVYNLKCMVMRDGNTIWQEKRNNGANSSFLRQGDEWWNNRHINGNGVYSATAEFVQWVNAEWGQRQDGPRGATDRCQAEGGFDELMFLDARQAFHGAPGGASRWREDSRFMDCKPVGPHKAAETMDTSQLQNKFPDAVMVHSRSAVSSPGKHFYIGF